MNLAEYSKHRGVTSTAVEQAILAGRITRNPDGSIDALRADAQWEANTDAKKRPPGRPKKGDAPVTPAQQAARHAATVAEFKRLDAESLDADKLGKLSFADARALKENFEAKLKYVELQKQQAKLLDREEVSSVIANVCRICRDSLLNIPSRLAASIVAMTEISDVQDAIAEEIRDSLEELSAALKRFAEGSPQ